MMNDHDIQISQRTISVRTPENIALSYALAGPASRAAAYFLDLMIMFAVCQILANLLMAVFIGLFSALGTDGQAWTAGIMGLVLFFLYNGYFIFLEWLWNGQTPGKRLVRIRVIKRGGYALQFFDTLSRNLLRVVDFLPAFYGVGLASLLLTRDSQRVGDLLSGTLVVYQEPVETDSLLPDLPEPPASEAPLPAAQLSAVPPEAMALTVEYLRSRTDLAPRPRQEIAAELVQIIRESSGLGPLPAQSIEGFLTAVVRQAEPGPSWTDPSLQKEVEFLS